MATPITRERVQRIQQKGQQVRREVGDLTTEVEGALGELEGVIREQLERRPYTTLAAAAGLGYVLGGGIPVALSRMMFGIGGRLAFVMLAQQFREGFAGLQENLAQQNTEPRQQHGQPRQQEGQS
jgi:hypothetical protein